MYWMEISQKMIAQHYATTFQYEDDIPFFDRHPNGYDLPQTSEQTQA